LGSLQNNDPTADMLTATPPGKEDDKEVEPTDGIDGFLANMEGAGVTLFDDKNEIEDELMVDDGGELADCDIDMGDVDDLMVEAQMMSPDNMKTPGFDAPPTPEPRKPILEERPKKVNEDPLTPDLTMPDQDKAGKTGKDMDAIIDTAFNGITIADVVSKLEDVANIFRNREISRQVSIIDLMMQKLNIQMYFSALGEVAQKNLDAAQYSLTRLDDMLSKLKGAMPSGNLDLNGKENATPPQAQGLVQSLEKSDQEEKQRKQMKKDLDTKQTAEKLKPVPEVEGVGEELAAPEANIEQPVPTRQPQRPVPPPGV
jgi:hypothetical protein